MTPDCKKQYHNWMVLYVFDIDQEEECQRMQELNKNHFEGLTHHTEENILARVVIILIVIGEHMTIEGPLREEDTKVRMGGHWMEETIRIEDILEEGIQIKMEDPLMMEDPLEMDDILDTLEDEDHQVHKDLLDQ